MKSSGSVGEKRIAFVPPRGSQTGCADPIGHADMLIAQLGEPTSIQLARLYAGNWPADTYWQRVLARLQEQRPKAAQMLPGEPRKPEARRPADPAPRPFASPPLEGWARRHPPGSDVITSRPKAGWMIRTGHERSSKFGDTTEHHVKRGPAGRLRYQVHRA